MNSKLISKIFVASACIEHVGGVHIAVDPEQALNINESGGQTGGGDQWAFYNGGATALVQQSIPIVNIFFDNLIASLGLQNIAHSLSDIGKTLVLQPLRVTQRFA